MERKPDRQEKIQNMLKMIEEGTKNFFESEQYKSFLTAMSKFHNYSVNNIILMLMQNPNVSLVAGFKKWNTEFKRTIKKGEKGLQILAYTPKTYKQEVEVLDNQGNKVIDKDTGKPVTETVSKEYNYFTPVYVFDVSQTEGEPLPQLTHELKGNTKDYEYFIEALKTVSKVPIGFELIPGTSKGYYSPNENRIAIKEGMSEIQTIKTIIHEMAHSELHNKEAMEQDPKTRNNVEVEAESIAFVVAQNYGIDTSEYSFGYVARWSSNKELKELQDSLTTISKKAEDLIKRLDEKFEEIKTRESKLEIAEYIYENFQEDITLENFDKYYPDLHNIDLAYTTLGNDEYSIQHSIDIVNNTYTVSFDDYPIEKGSFDSVHGYLNGADFDELVALDPFVLEKNLGIAIEDDMIVDYPLEGYISLNEMKNYGFHELFIQGVTKEYAIEIMDKTQVAIIYKDGSVEHTDKIQKVINHYENSGLAGIYKSDPKWQLRNTERLNSLIHDNEIDLDREKKIEHKAPVEDQLLGIDDLIAQATKQADEYNRNVKQGLNKEKEMER